MVAYSFKQRFEPAIVACSKSNTIRADRKRHARPGETVQLYFAQRSKSCRLIGTGICVRAAPITIERERGRIQLPQTVTLLHTAAELDAFAVADGFADWDDMRAFWRTEHPKLLTFHGVIIGWSGFTPAPALARDIAG